MKKNIIKTVYVILNLAFFAGIGAFCYFNKSYNTDFFCFIMQKEYTTKLIYLILLFSSFSYVSGIALNMFLRSKSDELCNAYQKRHENISAQKDNDEAKISALQAKIATLEAALQSALKKSDKQN